jgi:hypothetical protein
MHSLTGKDVPITAQHFLTCNPIEPTWRPTIGLPSSDYSGRSMFREPNVLRAV